MSPQDLAKKANGATWVTLGAAFAVIAGVAGFFIFMQGQLDGIKQHSEVQAQKAMDKIEDHSTLPTHYIQQVENARQDATVRALDTRVSYIEKDIRRQLTDVLDKLGRLEEAQLGGEP